MLLLLLQCANFIVGIFLIVLMFRDCKRIDKESEKLENKWGE